MSLRLRRIIITLVSLIGLTVVIMAAAPTVIENAAPTETPVATDGVVASSALESLAVKGRAPKTGYSRDQFGNGWATTNGCDTRNIILHRDLRDAVVDENCTVVSGTLEDSYTGMTIVFEKGTSNIQIDHVVALSDAWQKGAQLLTRRDRITLANDPLELIAVDGEANQQKSDGDAATWLPKNKAFRCQYIARQIAVKQKYMLWVTDAEKKVMKEILATCPTQLLPAK